MRSGEGLDSIRSLARVLLTKTTGGRMPTSDNMEIQVAPDAGLEDFVLFMALFNSWDAAYVPGVIETMTKSLALLRQQGRTPVPLSGA